MNEINKGFLKYCKIQIASGNADDAIKSLLNLDIGFENEIVLISNRWHELKKEKISGIISEENFSLRRNQITHNLLQLIDEVKTGLKKIDFIPTDFYSNAARFFNKWRKSPAHSILNRIHSINDARSNEIKLDTLILLNLFGSN